jgi:replicative DNA helicase
MNGNNPFGKVIQDAFNGFTMSEDQGLLDKINEQAKSSTERWEKIQASLDRLKSIRKDSTLTETEKLLIDTLMLIAEHFKPIGNTGESVKKIQEDIDNMVGAFLPGGKTK